MCPGGKSTSCVLDYLFACLLVFLCACVLIRLFGYLRPGAGILLRPGAGILLAFFLRSGASFWLRRCWQIAEGAGILLKPVLLGPGADILLMPGAGNLLRQNAIGCNCTVKIFSSK